jgi:hypothetical protein
MHWKVLDSHIWLTTVLTADQAVIIWTQQSRDTANAFKKCMVFLLVSRLDG